MARFVGAEDGKEIHAPWWENGETVEIRQFSYMDRRRIATRAVRMVPYPDGSTRAEVDMAALDQTMLEMGIARWTLTDGQGAPVSLDPGAIGRLSEADGEYILGEIAALNPRRSAEQQGQFRGGARVGTAEQSTAG